MSELLSQIQLTGPIFVDMEKLKNFLLEVNNCFFVSYENIKSDCEEVLYEICQGFNVKLKPIEINDVSDIISKLRDFESVDLISAQLLKSVIANNEDILQCCEILSHGITFTDAVDKLKTVSMLLNQYIESPIIEFCDSSSEIVQIELENHHLDSLIIKILPNITKKIVLIPSLLGRGAMSAFCLVYLLHKENPELKNRITFIFLKKPFVFGDVLLCTDSWLDLNRNTLESNTSLIVERNERKSCFMILNSSNIFIAVQNYISLLGGTSSSTRQVPTLCLVQESCYHQFVGMLKSTLGTSTELLLLDKNRQISVNYCHNHDVIDSLVNEINNNKNVNIISTIDRCSDNNHFYPSIVLDNCQPQQPLFSDKVANQFCSFILTFRTCQEGIMLANELFTERESVYLWTESISQCFSLKNQLKYDKIFVNIGHNNVGNVSESICQYRCDGSFFIPVATVQSDFISSELINSKLTHLRSVSKWKSESFHHRYSAVVKVTKKLMTNGLLSSDGGTHFQQYLECKVRPFEFNYFVKDSLNKLTESVSIGAVVIDLGKVPIDDIALQSILLIILFGNDLLVTSESDLSRVQTFLEVDCVAIVRGSFSLRSVFDRYCRGMVSAVVCLDGEVGRKGAIDELAGVRVVGRTRGSTVDGFFDVLVAGVRSKKALHILSGDIGIN